MGCLIPYLSVINACRSSTIVVVIGRDAFVVLDEWKKRPPLEQERLVIGNAKNAPSWVYQKGHGRQMDIQCLSAFWLFSHLSDYRYVYWYSSNCRVVAFTAASSNFFTSIFIVRGRQGSVDWMCRSVSDFRIPL